MLVRVPVLLPLVALFASGAEVRVVDALNGPFVDIQAAVDASADGDVVLVKSGTYSSVAIVARAVAVVADAGAVVDVQGSLHVRELAPHQTVLVAGLSTRGNYGSVTDSNGFRASECLGSVRVQDCVFQGGSTNVTFSPELPDGLQAGARIRACADVLIARARIVGGHLPGGYGGYPPMPRGGSAVDVGAARVALQDVNAGGANGGSCFSGCWDASSGGHGMFAREGSEIFAQAGRFVGGNGGRAFIGPVAWGGDGGYGLVLATTCPEASIARLLGPTLAGGAAGTGNCAIFCNPQDYDGSQGFPMSAYSCGTIQMLVGSAPMLSAPAVMRAGGTLPLTFTSSPGDVLWLRIAGETDHTWDPIRNGMRLVRRGLPERWLLIGAVGGSGQIVHHLPVGPLPPATRARWAHMQVQAQRAGGVMQLGAASSFVVLDASL
ncbi:MAG: hypothetical protein JNK02_07010 [Planctomycetes bacterium]|nr:hypothetical protein [Planctomycetota bacterium]